MTRLKVDIKWEERSQSFFPYYEGTNKAIDVPFRDLAYGNVDGDRDDPLESEKTFEHMANLPAVAANRIKDAFGHPRPNKGAILKGFISI